MSKLTFLSNNHLDDADLEVVSGGENAQFPVENIKKAYTTKVFRSLSNSVEILIDLKSTLPVDAFMIVGDSVKGKLGFATATLKGSGSPDFSLATPITIDLSPEHNVGWKLFTEASHRYWLLTLTGVEVVEVSNFFIGTKSQLEGNDIATSSFEFENEDNTEIQMNKWGQKFINTFNRRQTISGGISLVDNVQFDLLNEISDIHGKSKPIFMILDPEDQIGLTDSKWIFSGFYYFADNFKWKTITKNFYSMTMRLQEVV